MIVLRDIEDFFCAKLRHDRKLEYCFWLELLDVFLCSLELFWSPEYDTSILLATITPLSISTRRIMCGEEDIEQSLIRDDTRIIRDFHDLDIPAHSWADTLIGRKWDATSHIPRADLEYSLKSREYSVHTPETASSEIGFLEIRDFYFLSFRRRRNLIFFVILWRIASIPLVGRISSREILALQGWQIRYFHELHRERVDAVTSIFFCKFLTYEDMSEVTTTIRTRDLSTSTIWVKSPLHPTWDSIIERRPSTSRVELHIWSKECSITLPTDEDSLLFVRLVFSRVRSLCPLSDDDTRLFGREWIIVFWHIFLRMKR